MLLKPALYQTNEQAGLVPRRVLTNLNSPSLSSQEGTRMCTCECLVSRHFDIPVDILNGFKDTKVRALPSVQVQVQV